MFSLSTIDDPTRNALDASIRHFSKLVGWATIAVAIGVAMEAVEIVHDIVAWCKQWRRKKRELTELEAVAKVFPAGELMQPTESHPKEPKWVKRVLRGGLIIVVIGVVAEWRCGANLEDAHNALQTFDESLIADTQKEAEGLREQAEAEHLARVKIEARVAWRRLDPKILPVIASHLSQFTKQPALVSYNPSDIEAADFAFDIAMVLHAAKWDVFEPLAFVRARAGPAPFGTNGPVPRGVLVWPTNDVLSVRAAAALVDQLRAYGFDATSSADARFLFAIQPTSTRVAVSVEQKPDGPQGEFKLQAEREAKTKNTTTANH